MIFLLIEHNFAEFFCVGLKESLVSEKYRRPRKIIISFRVESKKWKFKTSRILRLLDFCLSRATFCPLPYLSGTDLEFSGGSTKWEKLESCSDQKVRVMKRHVC